MPLETLLDAWKKDADTGPNLPVWRTTPIRPARTVPLPENLPAGLAAALQAQGIHSLYSHQAAAWKSARDGENLVLATGTASGKTLAYNLPVLSGLLADPQGRALYLFPTKALTQDQLAGLQRLQQHLPDLPAAIYDGDTPQSARSKVRRKARILLSNPDMLHAGILPHHTLWEELLRGLRYVVIDEIHTYRGVFGSHVANVLRRLKRVAAFYGAHPQFLLTSATIGNPGELAGRLVEQPVTLIDEDGSGRGPRTFLLYNPPVVDPQLGLRKSALLEAVRLAGDLLQHRLQSVVFARSRRSVEIILRYLEQLEGARAGAGGAIRGYRSGYLPSQRRAIEQGLRDGSVRMVVATNALELGIDIGGLGAAMLVGYPGTVASTWQQAGRAGRGMDPAAAVLVATADPLDQFLAHHPDYFFGRSPENGLINPDHLLILLNHLRCAAFELPFHRGEGFGSLSPERIAEFLDVLLDGQELHISKDTYYWMADAYPAAAVSLRSASPENIILQTTDEDGPHALGEIDLASATWMVHPRAVYLHEGVPYHVAELDLERNVARLDPTESDYYTEPQRQTAIERLGEAERTDVPGGLKAWGELQVTTRVVGFRKLRWFTHENLGEEPLELPSSEFQTTGYWLSLSEAAIQALRDSGVWRNDPNDYGPGWDRLREAVRRRDGFRCVVCGAPEDGRMHDVHHKVPFRAFVSPVEANRMENLVTLCPRCHRQAEASVRMRSGLAGLGHVLGHLAPLFLMCDPRDLGVQADPQAAFADGAPAVVLYDQVPAGIGFSQKLYEIHAELLQRARQLVQECPCADGCPSCVGPGGENGMGGKRETLAILEKT